jgi:hypothetical protein
MDGVSVIVPSGEGIAAKRVLAEPLHPPAIMIANDATTKQALLRLLLPRLITRSNTAQNSDRVGGTVR